MEIYRKRDPVMIHTQGWSLEGVVSYGSRNGQSLMLQFEGVLAGYVGMMPIFWNQELAQFEDLVTRKPVELERRRRPSGDIPFPP